MALLRKRSATETELEREQPEDEGRASASHSSSYSEQLKRSRSNNELDATRLAGRDEAWHVDMSGMLAALKLATAQREQLACVPPDNFRNYDAAKSLFVLCVLGHLQIHYTLLCNNLASLVGLSQHIQIFALSRQPRTSVPVGSDGEVPISIPEIQAIGPSYNHFLKLGLLHPLGGGQEPLDAIVVIDTQGRRRLVLPVGWGAGHYVHDGAGGKMVQDRLMTTLRKGIQELERELKYSSA